MPRLGRFASRYKEIDVEERLKSVLAVINDDTPRLDLANDCFGKAKVRCWLEADGRTWGKWKEKNAAVLRLAMTTEQPIGCMLSHFQLDMEFSPSEATDSYEASAAHSRIDKASIFPVVWLLKGPFPKSFERSSPDCSNSLTSASENRYIQGNGFDRADYSVNIRDHRVWVFKSKPVPGIGGIASSACWTWEANQRIPDVEDCGTLFGAVALQHPGHPFKLSCHVSGKGYKSRFRLKFNDKSSGPRVWILQPSGSEEDVSEDIEQLEHSIYRMNISENTPKPSSSIRSIQEPPIHNQTKSMRSTTDSQQSIEEEREQAYGPSIISGSARVHMGNIALYNCQFNSSEGDRSESNGPRELPSTNASSEMLETDRAELAEMIKMLRRM